MEKSLSTYWLLGDLPAFDKDFLALFTKFQKQRGDNVILKAPFGYKFYAFFHPDAVEYILSTAQNNFPRMGHFTNSLGNFMGKGLLTTEGKERDQFRTLFNPSFTLKNLTPFADWIVDETEFFCETLPLNAEVDFFRRISGLTLRLTLGLIFGPDNFNCDPKFEYTLEECLLEITRRIQAPINIPSLIATPKNLKTKNLSAKLNKLVDEMIANAKESSYPTQLNFLRNLEGRSFSPVEIRDQIIPLLVVGNDTFAVSLAWTWYLLGVNPPIEEKLREEIRSVLKRDSPSFEDTKKLDYTSMVFQESMRLFPPAYAISRQNILPEEVSGIKLKKKSIVLLSQYITHRHPNFWERPLEFFPEHFTTDRIKERHRYAYFPFGSGKRICIGKVLSMTFGPLILATILNRKRVNLAKGQTGNYNLSFALRPKFGIKTIF